MSKSPQTKEVLDLSNKQLERIPKDSLRPEQASRYHVLKLSNNPMLQITEEIKNFEKLSELHACDCGTRKLPAELGSLKSLQKLFLFNNPSLKCFPDAILSLVLLIELNLGQCDLDTIPKEIHRLTKLQKLHLRGNRKLRSLPLEVFTLAELTELNVSQCGLTSLPDEVARLKQLDKLHLSGNFRLRKLPAGLFSLPCLAELNIGGCGLAALPEDIAKLAKLVKLQLRENRELRMIPPGVLNAIELKELNVAYCDLSELPEAIGRLSKLEKLHIFGNRKIRTLPTALYKLTGLRELNACFCDLIALGDLSHLRQLQILHLRGNQQLGKMEESIFTLSDLRELNMSQCGLSSIPDTIEKLYKLRKLHLFENPDLEDLPRSLMNLTNLEELSFSNCGISGRASQIQDPLKSCPVSLGRFEKLKKLQLSRCSRLQQAFPDISGLKALKEIDLSHCSLTSVPFASNGLQKLVKLEIGFNDLRQQSIEALFKMAALEELGVGGCGLEDIPDTIGDMANLKVLDLHSNTLQRISPTVFRQLDNLHQLNLRQCQLSAIPEEISELKHLVSLNVSGNELLDLPDSIGMLIQLEALDISLNVGLKQLPPVVTGLAKLRELNVSCCSLSSLPDDITKLIELEVLVAQNAGLGLYPVVTIDMKSLKKLDLSNCTGTEVNRNHIKELPARLLESSLEELLVHGNPMSKPPLEICDQGMHAIRRYLEDIIPGSRSICSEAISMLGDTGAGKTSIVLSLRHCQPSPAHPDDRTRVIHKEHISLQSEKIVVVNDFGGHDIYQTVLPMFLPPSGLGVLVYDMSESLDCQKEKVGKWMDTLLGKSPGIRLIVAGTHTDLVHPDSLASYENEMEAFVKEKYETAVQDIDGHLQKLRYIRSRDLDGKRKFLEGIVHSLHAWKPRLVSLSCDSCSSPEQGLLALHDLVSSSIQPPATLPASWCHIIKEIMDPGEEKLRRASFLTWDDVLQIFHQQAPPPVSSDEPEQKMRTILRYMVTTSQIIWLEDHPVLRTKIFHRIDHIIDICKAVLHHGNLCDKRSKPIAKIWCRDEAEYKQGHLSDSFLRYLLQDYTSCHDESLIGALVTLMVEFNLISIIRADGNEKKYIIPCRLGSEVPRTILNRNGPNLPFEPSVQLQILFYTAVMPLALFETSLAVVLAIVHKKGIQARCWKNGITFREDGVMLVYERSSKDVLDLKASAKSAQCLWSVLYPVLRAVADHVQREWKGSAPKCVMKCLACMTLAREKASSLDDAEDSDSHCMELEEVTSPSRDRTRNRLITCNVCEHDVPRALAVPCIPEYLDRRDESDVAEFLLTLEEEYVRSSTASTTALLQLKKHRSAFVNSLSLAEVDFIIDKLSEQGFINVRDKESLNQREKVKDLVRQLLDLIERKGNNTAEALAAILKLEYISRGDLAEILDCVQSREAP